MEQPWARRPRCVPAARAGEWGRLVMFAGVVWECSTADARDALERYLLAYGERYGVVPSLQAVRDSLAATLDPHT